MTDDRSWIDDRALAVLLDPGLHGNPELQPVTIATFLDSLSAWHKAGRPLLSARGKAVIGAVAGMCFGACIGFRVGDKLFEDIIKKPLCQEHGPCKVKEICRAYLSTDAPAASTPAVKPVCEKCGDTKRVRCPHNDPADDCTVAASTVPCPEGKEINMHGPCTIPCTCSKEKGT